jgi:hypothetical protein
MAPVVVNIVPPAQLKLRFAAIDGRHQRDEVHALGSASRVPDEFLHSALLVSELAGQM